MDLRDYQADQLDQTRERLRAGVSRLLLQLPTGGGKTVMAATMLQGAAKRGLRSWFVVHRKELIEQTSKTFTDVGIAHGFMATGFPWNPDAPVQLCGVQSIERRLMNVPDPDLIVWDEAHHCVAGTWSRVMNCYPRAKHLGLSATPERLDGRGLGEHFNEIVLGPSVADLIARGFLSPYRYFAPSSPDLSDVRLTAGDYNRMSLGLAMDKAKLVGDIVAHYQRLAPGEQGVVFAASIEHSQHIAAAFQAAGVSAAHVDGAMKAHERRAVVEAFRGGRLRMMTNVDLFGEGFDVPGMVYCGLARPTKSLGLFLQQVGRSLRIAPGKREAIICDHAGNALIHGLPDDERTWTLEGRKKRAGTSGPGDAVPIRQCLECYQISPSRAEGCVGCGVVFPSKARSLKQADGDLTEIDRATLKRKATDDRKAEERACRTLAEFTALGVKRGYENPAGWARHQLGFRAKWHRRAA